MRSTAIRRTLLAVVGTAVALAAAGLLGSVDAADQTVKIVDFGFQPASVTVTAGNVVTWQNTGSVQHTITADDGSFDSGPLSTSEQFAHLFDTAGTVAYHCSIHPAMTGKVTVTAAPVTPAPSGPQSPSPPPGTLPPGFTRHPGGSSAQPSSAPAISAKVAATVAPSSASSAQETGTPSAPASAPAGTLPLVLLVLVVLALAAAGAWLLYRRRPR